MKRKLYIIGKVPSRIDTSCKNKFSIAYKQLSEIGFIAINPVVRLTKKDFTFDEAITYNFQDLLFCDGVYILPCVPLSEKDTNLELKWALERNLFIINGLFDVIDE